jgi:mycoredoxin-dependent peroxiredoxin
MAEEKIKVGQEAPDFTLRDENRQEVKLSDLRGQPVMIAFYPFAFSSVCQGEMCTIRDAWSDFMATGARVLAISRDSIFSLKAWKEQQGFQHTLLSDMHGNVARDYGAWNEQLGAAERVTVVIDKDGKVTYVTRSENLGTPRDQMEALDALKQAVAA